MTRSSPSPSEIFNIADEFISRPAREYPSKPAILGGEREATYAQVEIEVIALPDSVEFVACFFGAAKIGAIAVPVNSMARAADYRHYLSNSGARFAMVHASILPEFASAIVGGALELVVVFGHTVSRLQNQWRNCRNLSDGRHRRRVFSLYLRQRWTAESCRASPPRHAGHFA